MSDSKPAVPDISSTNPRGEMLSALLDGESSDFETRRLVQSLTEEDEKAWRSYSLIQQAMLKSHNSQTDDLNLMIDVSVAVSAAIADEPTYGAQYESTDKSVQLEKSQVHSKFFYLKPAVGFAAAAAFAFLSVLNLESFQSVDSPVQGFVAQGDVSASQLPIQTGVGLTVVSAQAQLPADEMSKQTLDQEKLNRYLQRHAEQNALNNGRGLMPMVRVAKED